VQPNNSGDSIKYRGCDSGPRGRLHVLVCCVSIAISVLYVYIVSPCLYRVFAMCVYAFPYMDVPLGGDVALDVFSYIVYEAHG